MAAPDQPGNSDRAREASRRRALALLGAGGAAGIAALGPGRRATAGHDSTDVVHIGEINQAPAGSAPTQLWAEVDGRVFDVRNLTSGGGDAGAVQAWSSGAGPAVQGNATVALEFPPEGDGVGVLGLSGSGPGVFGVSAEGSGVEGHSQHGSGVRAVGLDDATALEAHSGSGVAGRFLSSGKALEVEGWVDIGADAPGREVLIVESGHPGEGALSATATAGGIGVEGDARPTDVPLEFEDQQLGYGVRGVSTSAEGGYGEGPGVGVHGISGTGRGVLATARVGGVAAEARSDGLEGIALLVHGRLLMTGVGGGTVPAGASKVFVDHQPLEPTSHVSVTLIDPPGPRSLQWVELHPGAGFTVHLTSAPPAKRLATRFTFAVLDPA